MGRLRQALKSVGEAIIRRDGTDKTFPLVDGDLLRTGTGDPLTRVVPHYRVLGVRVPGLPRYEQDISGTRLRG